MINHTNRRPLGNTGLLVSPLALGCWPIAGMTSLDVNDADSLATLREAYELGINFFDTAYFYGAAGESERLIARALGPHRDELVLATKCGYSWSAEGERVTDGRPETLFAQCEESLRRLNTDRVELLYLHLPDPQVPIEESAGALRRLQEQGKTLQVGLSNGSRELLERFQRVCPLAAYQPKYNMLQREIESDELPWCRENQVAVAVYWPLMKGLLAGKLRRDHQFQPDDSRATMEVFQGQQWQRTQDLLDMLREIASQIGCSVAQLVLRWTIDQPGITVALCGAKRPDQIRDNFGAMLVEFSPAQRAAIDAAVARRAEA